MHNAREQLERIEKKLDMIIEHFNIGASARAGKSTREIERQVNEKILRLQTRKRPVKKQACQSAN